MCLSLFCYALLRVHSSFEIILKRKRKLVAMLLLSYRCIVTINIMWLLLTVPWVGLQFVIVVFPDPTHLVYITVYCNSILYYCFFLCICMNCYWCFAYNSQSNKTLLYSILYLYSMNVASADHSRFLFNSRIMKAACPDN